MENKTMQINTATLKTIDLFSDAPNDLLKKISEITRIENYAAGQVLIEQGQQQDTIYMVADGEISLHSRLASGQKNFLDKVKPGGSIGMSALCEVTTAQFSAVCTQSSTLIVISIEDALTMFSQDYATGYSMMLVLLERFRQEDYHRTQQFLRSLRNYPEIYSTLADIPETTDLTGEV